MERSEEICRCGHPNDMHNQITGRCSWCECSSFHLSLTEVITIPVEKGDTILGGRFKNHPIKVKKIDKDDWNMPTVNGRKVVNFRIPRDVDEVDAVQWGGLAVKQTGNAIIWYNPKTGDVVKWVQTMEESDDDLTNFYRRFPAAVQYKGKTFVGKVGKEGHFELWEKLKAKFPEIREGTYREGYIVDNRFISRDAVEKAWSAGRPITEEKDEEDFPLHGKIYWKGIPIDVENARGSTRSGKDPDGHKWEVYMHHHYGRIRDTEAVDGDMLDVYVGPSHDSEYVYKVKQLEPDTGEFDEWKMLLGFDTPQEAKEAYLNQYDKPDFFGGISVIPFNDFKEMVRQNQLRKIANDQDSNL